MAAYRYVIKGKDISTMLHSQGHTPLECIRSPKTKKAFERFSQVSSEKKKRKLEENICVSCAPAKPVWLTNVDVSNLMVRQGIKTEDELLSLAWGRAQDGEPDLQSFVLNETPNALADLIETTWRKQGASRRLERSRKTRMQVISETLNFDCVETCGEKHWLKCAKKILRNNKINQYFFAYAMRNALIKGRQKITTFRLLEPPIAESPFLLDPLELILMDFLTPQQQNILGPTLKI